MLKKSLLILFALATAMQASAKGGVLSTEWGITAGVRFNGMKLSGEAADDLNAKLSTTYNVGLHAAVAFLGVAIQPELNYGYSQITMSFPTATAGEMSEKIVKVNELEVPVLLSLRMLPIVRFNVGPVFNIMSRATYNVENAKMMYGGIRPTYGYAVGVSICVLKKLLIDARFVGYFDKTTNEFNPLQLTNNTINAFKTKTYSGGIKVGYLF